nr:MAG TPA: hypothetical protein [Caudoviricetes sp.]
MFYSAKMRRYSNDLKKKMRKIKKYAEKSVYVNNG